MVGCVSRKQPFPCPAEDLYVSALFAGRRRFVEATCDDWYVLSAKHGLLKRSSIVDPYDVALTGTSRPARRGWAVQVLTQIDLEVSGFDRTTFEIHAGADYFAFGIEHGLVERGASVEIPTRGLRQGEQLRFYSTVGGRRA